MVIHGGDYIGNVRYGNKSYKVSRCTDVTTCICIHTLNANTLRKGVIKTKLAREKRRGLGQVYGRNIRRYGLGHVTDRIRAW